VARAEGALAPRFHVFAVDSYDSGKSPSWPSDSVITLRDEVDLIELHPGQVTDVIEQFLDR
jgi:hypothetical protein